MSLKLTVWAATMGLCLSFVASGEARAATFTFVDPEVDFIAADGEFFGGPLDGVGDEVFSTFSYVILSPPYYEEHSIAEFNISEFLVPLDEVITNATFQVRISDTILYGTGYEPGDNPEQLGVYGYVGNGIAETTDFQAGTLLDTVDTSSAFVGQFLTFDVTEFVQNLVSNGDSFVGLGVRAQEFGAISIEESSTLGFPRLTIATSAVSTTVPEPTSVLGLLGFGALGTGSMLKRKLQKAA
jgi:hypothetical protein